MNYDLISWMETIPKIQPFSILDSDWFEGID